jgi:hypothetical protein
LLAVLVEQLSRCRGPDAIAQVIKQFDDSEGLLRRPVGGNFERDGERQTGRDFAHDLAFASLARALLGAFLSLFETIGFALARENLGVMDQAIDQGDDAGGVGRGGD